MTALQAIVFTSLFLMTMYWFVMVHSFIRQTRERHPHQHAAMQLDRMLPKNFSDWENVAPASTGSITLAP